MTSFWRVTRDYPASDHTLRLRFHAGDSRLSYGGFLQALAENTIFRELIQDEMLTEIETKVEPESLPHEVLWVRHS